MYKLNLKVTPTVIDPSLYCQFEDEKIAGINESYIEGLPRAGIEEWKTHSDATRERFEKTGNQQASFT